MSRNLPQECPSCGADLSDPRVPPTYWVVRKRFSRVLSIDLGPHQQSWLCPDCAHAWPREEPDDGDS